MMKLFDSFTRDDGSPQRYTESQFRFLNRASGDRWKRVRTRLEKYFEHYPAGEALDLRNRFRSDDSQQHVPAWWELYLFTLFARLGWSVDVHPMVSNSKSKPDFLISRDATRCYVEAAVNFSGIVGDDKRDEKREAWICDITNELTSPNFHVGLEFEEVGTQKPRHREILAPLRAWLEQLDPDGVGKAMESRLEFPELRLSLRDWKLVYTAFPIRPEHRGQPGRLLGMGPSAGVMINDMEMLRNKLNKKKDRYGILDAPLVLAVMSMSVFLDNTDTEKALFGSTAYQFVQGRPEEGRWVRLPDGFWLQGNKPISTHVVAAILGHEILPWNHAKTLPRLWINPWANDVVPSFDALPSASAGLDGSINYSDPENGGASALFELPEDWSYRD